MKDRSRIGRRERHLDGVRIDLLRISDRLLNRFVSLAGKPENERAVNLDAELAAIVTEAACHIRAQPLFDIHEDLVVAGFVADEQKPQPVILHHLER
jgi:hypothetical protein